MKMLVLVQSYPNMKSKDLMYVHVRNLYYKKNGYDVTVLNFNSKCAYTYEGIRVIDEKTFRKEKEKYDYLVSHASNVRNHLRFLMRYGRQFERLVFFFHGHEVLRLSKEYPEPYDYEKKNSIIKKVMQDIYDSFKFRIYRRYYVSVANKARFIFVSNWLREKCFYYLNINSDDLLCNDIVINNSVGKVFEDNSYVYDSEKKYDFLTIRGNLDGSKYGVDIVYELAKKYPSFSFLIVGNGEFFQHNKVLSNITWINKQLNHMEMLDLMNECRYALMPTREDTQGVMTCEMATYGMPTITSDIAICKEIFSVYPNVVLVSNENVNLNKAIDYFENRNKSISNLDVKKYVVLDTLAKEISLFDDMKDFY